MTEYEDNLKDIKAALYNHLPPGLFLADDIHLMAAALAQEYAERTTPTDGERVKEK